MGLSLQNKSLELKKHVGLIHSTNMLSLLERKIANGLLYHAYENLLTKAEHEIDIPTLCAVIGYNSKDTIKIKDALRALISTVLEWNLVDKNGNENKSIWMASSMLSDAKIEGPICTYSYSNRMKELCYYPEFYGRLNMSVLSMFKSTYGIALYENCIRYQNISQTPWLDIVTYRKLMGVAEGKYEGFGDLNKRVIKPAVKEVNDHSPINIEPEYRRRGRAVTNVRFIIESAKSKIENINSTSDGLGNRLVNDYGVTANKIKDFIERYGENYILDKMSIIESSPSYQMGKIKCLAKYLEKALAEDFQRPKSSKDKVIKSSQQAKQKMSNVYDNEKMMNEYHRYLSSTLVKVYDALPGKEKEKTVNKFDKFISGTVLYGMFVQSGLKNPLVADKFVAYVTSHEQSLLSNIMSFDEFCKSK